MKAIWEKFVAQKSVECLGFYQFWVQKHLQVPVHFVRFEDLRDNFAAEMKQIMCFILDVDSVDGTIAEARIQELEGAQDKRRNYKARDGSSNQNTHRFSEAQLQAMIDFDGGEVLKTFGYGESFGLTDDGSSTSFRELNAASGKVAPTVIDMYNKGGEGIPLVDFSIMRGLGEEGLAYDAY